jgi:hypothetical protein
LLSVYRFSSSYKELVWENKSGSKPALGKGIDAELQEIQFHPEISSLNAMELFSCTPNDEKTID